MPAGKMPGVMQSENGRLYHYYMLKRNIVDLYISQMKEGSAFEGSNRYVKGVVPFNQAGALLFSAEKTAVFISAET